jgi:hypothetical protein
MPVHDMDTALAFAAAGKVQNLEPLSCAPWPCWQEAPKHEELATTAERQWIEEAKRGDEEDSARLVPKFAYGKDQLYQ